MTSRWGQMSGDEHVWMYCSPNPSSGRSVQGCTHEHRCEHRNIARKVARKQKKNNSTEGQPPSPRPLLDKRLSSGLVIGSFQMEMASGGADEQVHPQRSKLQFTRRQGIKRGKGVGGVWIE